MRPIKTHHVQGDQFGKSSAIVLYNEDIKEINARCVTIHMLVKAGRLDEVDGQVKAIMRLLLRAAPGSDFERLPAEEKEKWLEAHRSHKNRIDPYRLVQEIGAEQ